MNYNQFSCRPPALIAARQHYWGDICLPTGMATLQLLSEPHWPTWRVASQSTELSKVSIHHWRAPISDGPSQQMGRYPRISGAPAPWQHSWRREWPVAAAARYSCRSHRHRSVLLQISPPPLGHRSPPIVTARPIPAPRLCNSSLGAGGVRRRPGFPVPGQTPSPGAGIAGAFYLFQYQVCQNETRTEVLN